MQFKPEPYANLLSNAPTVIFQILKTRQNHNAKNRLKIKAEYTLTLSPKAILKRS